LLQNLNQDFTESDWATLWTEHFLAA